MYNLMGLGCDCQNHAVLGAVTKAQTEAFFIGPKKYVRNSKPTPIYVKPGDAPTKTIAANDNMGRVVALNTAGNWGKLDSGYYIFLADTMYTVELDAPPPNGLIDGFIKAAKEAASDVAGSAWDTLKPVVITGALIIVGGYFIVTIGKDFIQKKAAKIA